MKKRSDIKQDMKTRILEEALSLITDKKGGAGVALRELARRVGCTAPNIYNHFGDMNGLLNAAMQEINRQYMKTITAAVREVFNPSEIFMTAADTLVSFALEHEGWFNFFHFERLSLTLTGTTHQESEETGQYMSMLVRKASEDLLSDEDSYRITGLIHHYLLGELSQYVSGRLSENEKTGFKERICRNARTLFDQLLSGFTDSAGKE